MTQRIFPQTLYFSALDKVLAATATCRRENVSTFARWMLDTLVEKIQRRKKPRLLKANGRCRPVRARRESRAHEQIWIYRRNGAFTPTGPSLALAPFVPKDAAGRLPPPLLLPDRVTAEGGLIQNSPAI